MKSNNQKNKIYNSIKGLTEALGQVGLYKEAEVETPDEVKSLKSKVAIHSWILIGIAIVVVVAFAGFVFDAIYFHITNNRYFENVYELKNTQNDKIDILQRDVEILKNKHPDFFK